MNPLVQQAARAVTPLEQSQQQPPQTGMNQAGAEDDQLTPEEEVEISQVLDPSGVQPEDPTPEEQEMFTRAELAIKNVIYSDKKSFGAIANMLEEGKDDPVNTLAAAGLMVFQTVDGLTEGGLPEIIIMRSAEVALDYVIDLAETKMGIMDINEDTANQAMKALVKKAGEAYGIDVSEIEAAYSNQAPPGGATQSQAPGDQPSAQGAAGAV